MVYGWCSESEVSSTFTLGSPRRRISLSAILTTHPPLEFHLYLLALFLVNLT